MSAQNQSGLSEKNMKTGLEILRDLQTLSAFIPATKLARCLIKCKLMSSCQFLYNRYQNGTVSKYSSNLIKVRKQLCVSFSFYGVLTKYGHWFNSSSQQTCNMSQALLALSVFRLRTWSIQINSPLLSLVCNLFADWSFLQLHPIE